MRRLVGDVCDVTGSAVGLLFAQPSPVMYGGWDSDENTDVERTASSLIRLPLPPPDESDELDLDAPTRPRLACLAVGTGPLAVIAGVSAPVTPRWAFVSIGVLATAAAALAAMLVLG